MHALLHLVQTEVANIAHVLIAILVQPLRITVELVVAEDLDLLLVLGFVPLLDALRCLDGE